MQAPNAGPVDRRRNLRVPCLEHSMQRNICQFPGDFIQRQDPVAATAVRLPSHLCFAWLSALILPTLDPTMPQSAFCFRYSRLLVVVLLSSAFVGPPMRHEMIPAISVHPFG